MYQAPEEEANARKGVSPQWCQSGDIYRLGLLLYEALQSQQDGTQRGSILHGSSPVGFLSNEKSKEERRMEKRQTRFLMPLNEIKFSSQSYVHARPPDNACFSTQRSHLWWFG